MLPAQHHAESHALFESVGRVTFTKAMKRPMERFGRLVQSQKLPSDEKYGEAIKSAIQQHKTKTKPAGKTPKEMARLKKRAEILKKMREIGFKPHALHVAAALAFENGLGKEDLLPAINHFQTTNKKVGGILYTGFLTAVASAVRLDLLKRVHDVLHENPEANGSKDIARALHVEPSQRNLEKITDALGVLDLTGLTHKLPPELAGRAVAYKWVHACHQQTKETLPRWNLDWIILNKILEGRAKTTDFTREFVLYGKKVGSNEGIASRRGVKNAFLRLEETGLIKINKKKEGWVAEFTEVGKRLMKEQAELDYLHPFLRIALLGLPPERKRTTG